MLKKSRTYVVFQRVFQYAFCFTNCSKASCWRSTRKETISFTGFISLRTSFDDAMSGCDDPFSSCSNHPGGQQSLFSILLTDAAWLPRSVRLRCDGQYFYSIPTSSVIPAIFTQIGHKRFPWPSWVSNLMERNYMLGYPSKSLPVELASALMHDTSYEPGLRQSRLRRQ